MNLDIDTKHLENNFNSGKIYVVERNYFSGGEIEWGLFGVEKSILRGVRGLTSYNYIHKKYEYIENFYEVKDYLLHSLGMVTLLMKKSRNGISNGSPITFANYMPFVSNTPPPKTDNRTKVHEFDNSKQINNYLMARELSK